MNRRTFLELLAAGAGALAAPGAARALTGGLPDTSKLVIGQVEHGGRWNPRPSALTGGPRGPCRLVSGQGEQGGRWSPRPSALRRLEWELAQRTSSESSRD